MKIVKVVNETAAISENAVDERDLQPKSIDETESISESVVLFGIEQNRFADEVLEIGESVIRIGGKTVFVSGGQVNLGEFGPPITETVEIGESVVVIGRRLVRCVNETLQVEEAVHRGPFDTHYLTDSNGNLVNPLLGFEAATPRIIAGLVADLPPLRVQDTQALQLFGFACSVDLLFRGAWWRRLYTSDEELVFATDGVFGGESVLFRVLDATYMTGSAAPDQVDSLNYLDVQVMNGNVDLSDATLQEALAGRNWVVLNGEVFAFMEVTLVDRPRPSLVYRLSKLIRGIRQTPIVNHSNEAHWLPGQYFAAMVSDNMLPIPAAASDMGSEQRYTIADLGRDMGDVDYRLTPVGRTLLPMRPANLRSSGDGSNTLVQWDRVSRSPGVKTLSSQGGDPLDEDRSWVLEFLDPDDGSLIVSFEVTGTESYSYAHTDQLGDYGFQPSQLTARVHRTNSFGAGEALTAILEDI